MSSTAATAPPGREAVAGDHVTDVYRYAVRCGVIESPDRAAAVLGLTRYEIGDALTRLTELRLLREDGRRPGRLLPVDPEYAVAELTSPIERAIFERREHADRLKESIEEVTRSVEHGPATVGAITRLESVSEIRGMLKLAGDVCREELAVLRGGQDGDGDETVDEILDACFGVLDRDVSVRVISPHRSRSSFTERAKSKRLVEGGASVRTLSQVPQAAVVFDRSVAVVLHLPRDGSEVSARRFHDDGLARFVIDMFDQLWEQASPLDLTEPGYADIVSDLHQSIAGLLAQGYTDEVVARKFGMSIRTCRRHISALCRELDSVSRFQAGVRAGRRYAFEG
ncbi:hypothetical protein [Streptomyces sp. NPDC056452]|uniref:hypothetical protein n=1 Tax=Streptomyces sp. NPDC056452 TaxID=3345821 RepID=UPI0036B09DD5